MAQNQHPATGTSSTRPIALRAGGGPRAVLIAKIALLAVISLAIYWPCLRGGFIWDDEVLVSHNQAVKDLHGLPRIWFSTEIPDYWPMTYSSFWLEWRLWGWKTTGYHVTNVVLHVVACLLLWKLLARLRIPGAYLAALLFAVHPVNVESVAWIAQRKNLLSIVFFLLSMLWYLEFDLRGRWRWYALSLFGFVLAMLSKGSVAMLPILLLLVVWWRRPLVARDVWRVVPFFGVAAVLTGVNVWFQTHGATESIREANFLQRLLGASGVVWFYLYKALLPVELMFVYPLREIDPHAWRWWLALVAAIGVTVGLWTQRNGWLRPLLFAWLFFCIALVPVMGFTDVYFMKYALVADHYQQIALVAVVALVAAAWNRWFIQAMSRLVAAGLIVVAALVVSTLAAKSWQMSRLYVNATTIYEAALASNPESWLLNNNLGARYSEEGHFDRAIPLFEKALKIQSDYRSETNLGRALFEVGLKEKAKPHLSKALQLNPTAPVVHSNLGVMLADSGQIDAAKLQFNRALELDPEALGIRNQLVSVLIDVGRYEEAKAYLDQMLKADPDNAETYNTLGRLLLNQGRAAEALTTFKKAEQLKPDSALAICNIGSALAKLGKRQEAIEEFNRALSLETDYAPARNNLAYMLLESGDLAGAEGQARQAIKLDPRYADGWVTLGVIQSKAGEIQEAITSFYQALQFKANHIVAHVNLGDALLKLGDNKTAEAQYRQSLALNPELNGTRINLAVLLRRENRVDEAIAEYEDVIRRDPAYVAARHNLGLALQGAGRFAEARAQFQEAVRLQPNLIGAWLNLANVSAELGDVAEALASAETALQLAKSHEPPLDAEPIEKLIAQLRAREQAAPPRSP